MIVRFVDPNVDGCGTDVECFMDIVVDAITQEIEDIMHKAVAKYKEENPDCWDSDGVFNAVYEAVERAGYEIYYSDIVETIEL